MRGKAPSELRVPETSGLFSPIRSPRAPPSPKSTLENAGETKEVPIVYTSFCCFTCMLVDMKVHVMLLNASASMISRSWDLIGRIPDSENVPFVLINRQECTHQPSIITILPVGIEFSDEPAMQRKPNHPASPANGLRAI